MLSPEKLQQKVKDVVQLFPWYRDLIEDREVRGLPDLPLMTPDLLERHYYNRQAADSALSVYQTSGTSSGKRKKIVYSAEDDERYLQLKAKLFAGFIQGSGIRKALADMGTGHAANTAALIYERIGLENESISFQAPIREHLAKLEAFRPDLLYTMPSILDHIVYEARDPLAFGIKKIILVGEIASRHWIRRMAETFGIAEADIMDTYGSIEIGTIAYFDHKLQRYLFVEEMVAEGLQAHTVDPDLEELGEGESILALTSFARRLFPALRFVTYDVVRDFRTETTGGKTVQSFRSIVKRVGPELKHGEKISIYDIEEVVFQHLQDAAVRVRVQDNRLGIYIKSKSLTGELEGTIQEDLQRKIPEIGIMIQSGILAEIEVIAVGEGEQLLKGTVKNKKLYTEP